MTANDILAAVGASSAKPLVSVLLLPPVPLLLLGLAGAALLARRRLRSGWTLTLLAVVGLWLSQCQGMGRVLQAALLPPLPALSPQDVAALKRGPARRVVLVLGGGRESL